MYASIQGNNLTTSYTSRNVVPENPTGAFELSPPYAQMSPVNTEKPNLGQLKFCLFFVMDDIT